MTTEHEFFLDPSRCIGCQACVQACGECETHRGVPMIHLDYVDRAAGVQTAPVVCMHCEDPTCARVCPADAIKQDDRGIVLSAAKPRCVACSNCVLACPFGVPKMQTRYDLMMNGIRPEEIAEPPQSIFGILRQTGPGITLAASIVGSGELIATTTLGAL